MSRITHRMLAGGLPVLIAALVIAVPGTAARDKPKTKDVDCDLTLVALIPQPAATAANVGGVRCNHGIGLGADQDSSTTTRTGPLTGFFSGPFTWTFPDGTITGTFSIDFVTTVGGNPPHITGVTYDGTVQVSGGTGEYAGVSGAGTVEGFSPDAKVTSLTEELELTGL